MGLRDRGLEIKTPEQIDLMRVAGRLVGETLELLREAVRPGATTPELDTLAEAFNAMAARGDAKYARYYETIINNFARQPNLVRDLVTRGYLAMMRQRRRRRRQ